MQDTPIPLFEDGQVVLSERVQHLISYFEEQYSQSHHPSLDVIKRVTEFLVLLPEQYQALGMTKIAEYLINRLDLHFLDIIATFQQKAEHEGIDAEERRETIRGVVTEFFPEMMGISKQISIRSIDDLVTLNNITSALYTLSQVHTAAEAQGWMYELPTLYWRQLAQERLVTNIRVQISITQNQQVKTVSGAIAWKSSLPNPVHIIATKHDIPTIA